MQSLDHAPLTRPISLPDKVALEGLEERWTATGTRTPPTASTARRTATTSSRSTRRRRRSPGSLHIGHVFNFTQIDVVARYWRMRGKAVFFPIGWDDNGLPTERRVQNFFGVRCDPSLPYDPDFAPPAKPPERAISISRKNFVELCGQLTESDEEAFEDALPAHRALGRLELEVHDDLRRGPARLPTRLSPHARGRPGLPARGPDAVGRRLLLGDRPGRARGPRDRRRLPPPRVPTKRRRRASSRSRRRARSCCRHASRSSPTPTTPATSRSSARACARRSSTSRSPSSPTSSPIPRRARASR